MIISLVNQKGGVGKSTTAINLAASLTRKNCKLVFIDTDPQGSAVRWHAIENNKAFEIKHHPRPINHQDLNELAWDYDHVVIDAPPERVPELLAALASQNLFPSEVRPIVQSLENVFLKLTGEEQLDA